MEKSFSQPPQISGFASPQFLATDSFRAVAAVFVFEGAVAVVDDVDVAALASFRPALVVLPVFFIIPIMNDDSRNLSETLDRDEDGDDDDDDDDDDAAAPDLPLVEGLADDDAGEGDDLPLILSSFPKI